MTLQMWKSVTRVQYNPSLVYTGSVYGQVEDRDDTFFNDAALKPGLLQTYRAKWIAQAKKLRIPMDNLRSQN